MNEYANPTPLCVGMAGRLNGSHFSVAGRVVMGMTEGDETYYWNEYHLVNDAGQSATLVFEETDDGPAWKLFTLFAPTDPLTAAEAATKKIGDVISLDGTAAEVSLVSRSRVYHIEGRAPEGVDIGDVANYFNCDAGPQMVVVSWTGVEVECYRGQTLPTADVVTAFNLPRPASAPVGLADTGSTSTTGLPARGIVGLFGVVVAVLVGYGVYSSLKPPAPLPNQPAHIVTLTIGATGTLAATAYTVAAHTTIAVAKTAPMNGTCSNPCNPTSR